VNQNPTTSLIRFVGAFSSSFWRQKVEKNNDSGQARMTNKMFKTVYQEEQINLDFI